MRFYHNTKYKHQFVQEPHNSLYAVERIMEHSQFWTKWVIHSRKRLTSMSTPFGQTRYKAVNSMKLWWQVVTFKKKLNHWPSTKKYKNRRYVFISNLNSCKLSHDACCSKHNSYNVPYMGKKQKKFYSKNRFNARQWARVYECRACERDQSHRTHTAHTIWNTEALNVLEHSYEKSMHPMCVTIPYQADFTKWTSFFFFPF